MFQSMTDKPRQRCPECSGKVERLISGGAGLLFKGSGFYATDYRSEGYKKAAKADSDSGKSGGGTSDSGKSESGKSESGKSDAGSKDKTSGKPGKKETPSAASA